MTQDELKLHVHNLIVKKIKNEKIINQKTLSAKCHVSEMTVSKWIRDEKPSFPSADVVPDLCEALGITLYEFYGLDHNDLENAMNLYKAYTSHPDRQDSVKVLLEIK